MRMRSRAPQMILRSFAKDWEHLPIPFTSVNVSNNTVFVCHRLLQSIRVAETRGPSPTVETPSALIMLPFQHPGKIAAHGHRFSQNLILRQQEKTTESLDLKSHGGRTKVYQQHALHASRRRTCSSLITSACEMQFKTLKFLHGALMWSIKKRCLESNCIPACNRNVNRAFLNQRRATSTQRPGRRGRDCWNGRGNSDLFGEDSSLKHSGLLGRRGGAKMFLPRVESTSILAPH